MLADRTARIIPRADRRILRWANGLGSTAEIAAGADSRWRFSIATLDANSTFSSFPGVDRIFTVIGPHPVSLDFDASPTVIPRLSPTSFAGERAPVCVAAGPTEAFNVMVERSSAAATVEIMDIEIPFEIHLAERVAVLVLVLDGRLTTDLGSVGRGECLLVERGVVTTSGHALVLKADIFDRQ
ncbi:HutD family protein [Rhodococcus sp. IEGM 1379]|uniref:HutD/Ves family protein n=1 Tax=Rhodococcus sp. IEGM 1379 TaxID=3047086 RepID=UPI0024B6E488|nr:HutD family protein [Rhodococcus sp. IEGM 1379]MDI9915596.1 HutD family protein [Rhodococcus sp. IEGM 1379]